MKHSAVVVDNWELLTFKFYFFQAGFEYTQEDGHEPDTFILHIASDDVDRLKEVVAAARIAAKEEQHG